MQRENMLYFWQMPLNAGTKEISRKDFYRFWNSSMERKYGGYHGSDLSFQLAMLLSPEIA